MGNSAEVLKAKGLVEIRVALPQELCDELDKIVAEKLRVKEAHRRAGKRTSSERISRSSEVTAAVSAFVNRFKAFRKLHGEPDLPEPRPRGRPRKKKD